MVSRRVKAALVLRTQVRACCASAHRQALRPPGRAEEEEKDGWPWGRETPGAARGAEEMGEGEVLECRSHFGGSQQKCLLAFPRGRGRASEFIPAPQASEAAQALSEQPGLRPSSCFGGILAKAPATLLGVPGYASRRSPGQTDAQWETRREPEPQGAKARTEGCSAFLPGQACLCSRSVREGPTPQRSCELLHL